MPDKMVNLKQAANDEMNEVAMDSPEYPYGTRLMLTDDLIDELGLTGMAVGDEVQLVALGKVTEKSEHDSEDHEHRSLEIQVTDMAVTRERNETSREELAQSLYGD